MCKFSSFAFFAEQPQRVHARRAGDTRGAAATLLPAWDLGLWGGQKWKGDQLVRMPSCCCEEEEDKSEAAPRGEGRARYDASFMSTPPAWVEPAAAPLKPPPPDKKAGAALGNSMKSGSAGSGQGGSAAGLELRAAPRTPIADDLPEVSTLSRAQMNWAIARCARGALLCARVRCFLGGLQQRMALCVAAAARAPRRAVPCAAGATGLACGGAAPRPALRAHACDRAAGWRALAPWWHFALAREP
jgi:hypothetical protein